MSHLRLPHRQEMVRTLLNLPRGLIRPAIVALLGGALMLGATEQAKAAELPPGFQEDPVLSGLNQPTAVRFADDERVFVAERSGLIKVFDGLDDTTPTQFADLRPQVHDYWDRGLLGLALDPNFPAQPNVYVLYAHDSAGWGDGCPDPPGGTGDGCVISGRLSRLVANPVTGQAGPEQVLIDTEWCQQYPSHSIGSLAFGQDGALYASAGDGASFNFADYGQDGSPLNPCGDPPTGVGGMQTRPTAEGGALRSQDVRTTSDPTSLDGAILRLNPATGAAMAGNPTTSGDANARRIVAYGLRNPFRFTIRPGTNEVWIGDVGWSAWEEINRLANPLGPTVENFGWPCYEGGGRQPGYDGLDLNMCEALYNASPSPVVSPYYAYHHNNRVVSGEGCAPGSSAISGMAFYEGGSYPSPRYNDALFFADAVRGCIWVMHRGADGLPNPADRATFVDGAAAPVDLQIGPGGDLFYVDLGGTVRRIENFAANRPPTAVATANPQSGPAPLNVQFDGRGSSDPDPGDSITEYDWDLDADGQFDDSSDDNPTRTYPEGEFPVRLRVTDEQGETDESAPITIISGNSAPEVAIDAPPPGTTWRVGEQISFSGHADDPDDGPLPATDLSWSLNMRHCPSNCHTHAIRTIDDVATGSFLGPDHEYPSHLELTLTATDPGGLRDTETLRLDPETVDLSFKTSPVDGVELAVDADSERSPFSRRVIIGSRHSVAAPASVLGSPAYSFDSWSDGGDRGHDIVAPAGPTSYTATYRTGALPSGSTPSNDFGIGKLKRDRKRGTGKLTVKVPGPGTLDLTGRRVKDVAEHAADAGKVKLPVRPGRRKMATLLRLGDAEVRVRVTFTPEGGNPNTEKATLTLIKRRG